MRPINLSRVILGGILAGIIVNFSEYMLHDVVLKSFHDEGMKAIGKTMPQGGMVILWWVVMSLIWGIAAVWLYAAIRPRYGAGPGTAVRAGVAAWILTAVLSAITITNLGLMPFSGTMLVWELVQDVVATVAGAWLYKEAA